VSILRHVRSLAVVFAFATAVVLWHFPYATDDPVRREDAVREFYQIAYEEPSVIRRGDESARQLYSERVREDIKARVQRFVDRYRLHNTASVLDVGSGNGYLQDFVLHYTGLDISAAVAKHYHKRFVHGTATAMPFADNTFDAAWSIFVLEHIPNPEAALAEIRRVVRPGGLLFLRPAWDCKPWAAQGYAVRPFSDFGIGGKLIKASIPIRQSEVYWLVTAVPNRLLRVALAGSGPTRLHYRRIEPNFTEHWQSDSDAVNDLDELELAMWFESRGDTCLSCFGGGWRYLQRYDPLVIRVNKAHVLPDTAAKWQEQSRRSGNSRRR
jgi:SAM-dependent methyltransferase